MVVVSIPARMNVMLKKMPDMVSDQFPIIYTKHLIGKDETPNSDLLKGETFEYFSLLTLLLEQNSDTDEGALSSTAFLSR